MIKKTRTATALVSFLVVTGFGVGDIVASGIYNVAADDHHAVPGLPLLRTLRDHSITARVRKIDVPDLTDRAGISAGARLYANLCADCHLAPGSSSSESGKGMYPRPTNLVKQPVIDVRRTFWVTKHGIKMSGMPAWSASLEDADIWGIVAFLERMPNMSEEDYRQLSGQRAK
jgi:mono/diheme cytochrome c family protein